jgi:hypothetical protein
LVCPEQEMGSNRKWGRTGNGVSPRILTRSVNPNRNSILIFRAMPKKHEIYETGRQSIFVRMRGLTSFLLPRMNKVHKILVGTALIIIIILLARLIIHKEKVFTTVTKIQLLREDPELTKRKSEDLENEMTSEEKNQDYMLNNHNHSTK